MILYGLPTCATCNKARKALADAGKDVEFRDVRAEPLSEAELAELIVEFGDRLVDRTSNDWRGLSDWLKQSEAEAQIAAKPVLMTRPVIRAGEVLHLGWNDQVERAVTG